MVHHKKCNYSTQGKIIKKKGLFHPKFTVEYYVNGTRYTITEESGIIKKDITVGTYTASNVKIPKMDEYKKGDMVHVKVNIQNPSEAYIQENYTR